jgi:hypothetical protein
MSSITSPEQQVQDQEYYFIDDDATDGSVPATLATIGLSYNNISNNNEVFAGISSSSVVVHQHHQAATTPTTAMTSHSEKPPNSLDSSKYI